MIEQAVSKDRPGYVIQVKARFDNSQIKLSGLSGSISQPITSCHANCPNIHSS